MSLNTSGNSNIAAAWKYHNLTKHSYHSIRNNPHYLDWPNTPYPFKIYEDVKSVSLPGAPSRTGLKAIDAISDVTGQLLHGPLDVNVLARILFYSAGVMREKSYPGGAIYFRAAACAGALYPVEVYVINFAVEGLEPGVYHFNPRDFALDVLRNGDFSGELFSATSGSTQGASAVLAFSAISWRSTWKYRDRAYRYHFWDNGTILANALAMSRANRISAEVILGFADGEIGQLMAIDMRRELPLSLMRLGNQSEYGAGKPVRSTVALPELQLKTVPLSPCEVEYPSILEIDAASRLIDQDAVARWREKAIDIEEPVSPYSSGQETSQPIHLPAGYPHPNEGIESVIARRASTRRFAKKPIALEQLTTVLLASTSGFCADFGPPGQRLNDVYVIAHRVAGLNPGAYFYDIETSSLELLKKGDFSSEAAYLALDQDLGGDGGATLFLMADLPAVLGRLGNRGYRAAQLEAGIIAGKQYLAAYAVGLGATGLTFYDDDVTEFFSPHASRKNCMLVIAIGVPGKRPLF